MRALASFTFLIALLSAPAAHGQTAVVARGEHRLEWQPDWRRFGWVDAAQTAVTLGAYLYVEFGIEPGREARWTGPIPFDSAARDAFAADSRDGRDRAATVSHVLWLVPTIYPFADSVLTPLLFDDWNWDIAWELSAMNAQAASVNALITRFGHRVIRRERPDVEPCERDPNYSHYCNRGPFASFPGGHSSAAMMGAGLICAHHANLPLYGGGAPDVAACAVTLAMGLTGTLARMVADRHYASDSYVGASIGIGTGFLLPVLLHYGEVGGFSSGVGAARLRWTPIAVASEDTLGLGIYGWM